MTNRAGKFWAFLLLLAFVSAALLSGAGAARAGAPGIAVDLSRPSASTLKQGLVNGPNRYAGRTAETDRLDTFLSALKLTSWRFSGQAGYGYGGDIYGFVVNDYHYNTRFGATTVQNLQDIVNARYGKPLTVKKFCGFRRNGCFASFDSLRTAWTALVTEFLTRTQGSHIDYFDLLGEADLNSFVNVSPDQIYTLMKDEYDLVRKLRPDAKVVGPSNSGFGPILFGKLMDKMVADGMHFDAFSWHEFGPDPAAIGQHVAAFKSLLQRHPALCTPACPAIHINEYEGEDTMLIPGAAVAWLNGLESAGVAEANRACWGGDEGSPILYESCWQGLSGFLTPDSKTPQPLYWVYKFYADLNGSRYTTTSTAPGIAAISGDVGGSLGILAGNLGADQKPVQVRLAPFTKGAAKVDVYRIANTFNRVVSLPKVDIAKTFDVTAENTALTFQLDDIASGDAYWIVVTPR